MRILSTWVICCSLMIPTGVFASKKSSSGLDQITKSTLLDNVTVLAIVGISCDSNEMFWQTIGLDILGAAGYFLVMEGMFKQKQVFGSKKAVKEYELPSGKGAKQIDAFEKAAQVVDEAAEAGESNSKNQKIAAMGFAAASAAALIEALMDSSTRGMCVVTQPTGADATPSHLDADSTLLGANSNQTTSGTQMMADIGNWFGFMPSFVTTAFTGVADKLMGVVNDGYIRAAVFGGFAAVTFMASQKTGDAAKKLREQAQKYRDIAFKMRTPKAKQRLAINSGTKRKTIRVAADRAQKGEETCFVKAAGKLPKMAADCSCRRNNSCAKNPYSSNIKFPGIKRGGSIADAASSFADVANANYRGDSAAARLASNKLQRAAARNCERHCTEQSRD